MPEVTLDKSAYHAKEWNRWKGQNLDIDDDKDDDNDDDNNDNASHASGYRTLKSGKV